MKDFTYPVGEMLKRARKERNLTLDRLSRAARVPPSTIWKYENEPVDYSFLTVMKLASALNKSLDYVLGRGENGRDDVLLAGPEDGVSCEVCDEHWRLDLHNRRLSGEWMVSGVMHLFPGAIVQPRKTLNESLFLRCLEGTIDITYGDRQYILIEDYAMQFPINEDVTIRNRGEADASAELVATRFPFVL